MGKSIGMDLVFDRRDLEDKVSQDCKRHRTDHRLALPGSIAWTDDLDKTDNTRHRRRHGRDWDCYKIC